MRRPAPEADRQSRLLPRTLLLGVLGLVTAYLVLSGADSRCTWPLNVIEKGKPMITVGSRHCRVCATLICTE